MTEKILTDSNLIEIFRARKPRLSTFIMEESNS